MSLEYLGTGLKYPLQLVDGKPLTVSGKELVEQSVIDVLENQLGTRFFFAQYGSRLKNLIFEQNDDVLFSLLNVLIFEAVRDWETRIQFIRVDCSRQDAYVECKIYYRILNSNEIDSFIYPFYTQIKY